MTPHVPVGANQMAMGTSLVLLVSTMAVATWPVLLVSTMVAVLALLLKLLKTSCRFFKHFLVDLNLQEDLQYHQFAKNCFSQSQIIPWYRYVNCVSRCIKYPLSVLIDAEVHQAIRLLLAQWNFLIFDCCDYKYF